MKKEAKRAVIKLVLLVIIFESNNKLKIIHNKCLSDLMKLDARKKDFNNNLHKITVKWANDVRNFEL